MINVIKTIAILHQSRYTLAIKYMPLSDQLWNRNALIEMNIRSAHKEYKHPEIYE